MKRLLSLALLLGCSGAYAQAPAAAAAPAAVPAFNCTKPTLIPPTKAFTKKESEKLNADNKSYQDCVKGYVNERKKLVDEYNAIIKPHADAAMAAKAEFDGYITELNANLAEREKLGN